MSSSDDFDAYLKGYEDAMIAAGQARPGPGREGRRRPRGATRNIAEKVGEKLGYAFGWLVLFPVFMGLMGGSVGWVLGGDFAAWALAWGGLAFLFALFAGAAIVGFRIFLATWPIILVAVAVILVVTKLVD